MRKLGLYLIRWQLSTPILAACVIYLPWSPTMKTVVANLIGGLIFFWVDRWIFGFKMKPRYNGKVQDTVQDGVQDETPE